MFNTAANKNENNPVYPAVSRLMNTFIMTLRQWRETAKQRRELGELDDRLLQDIGVTRQHAMEEAARPFWDDPAHIQRQERRRVGYRFFGLIAGRQYGS